jgi:hypothetical protein
MENLKMYDIDTFILKNKQDIIAKLYSIFNPVGIEQENKNNNDLFSSLYNTFSINNLNLRLLVKFCMLFDNFNIDDRKYFKLSKFDTELILPVYFCIFPPDRYIYSPSKIKQFIFSNSCYYFISILDVDNIFVINNVGKKEVLNSNCLFKFNFNILNGSSLKSVLNTINLKHFLFLYEDLYEELRGKNETSK